MGWMTQRKWKEAKQLPGTAGPCNMLGCCFISFHFLWAIHPIRPVKRFTIHYRQISSKDAFHLTLGPSKVCFQGVFVFRTSICLELKDRSGNTTITETLGGNYCVPLYVLDCWLLLITLHQSPEQTSFF